MTAVAISLVIVGWLLIYSGFTGASPLDEVKAVFGR